MILDPQPDDYRPLLPVAEALGIECRFCRTGEQLMQSAGQEADLYLVHYELPDMPGTDVIDWLDERDSRDLRFVVMDQYDPVAELAVLQRGNAQLLIKPLEPALLVDAVAALSRRRFAGAPAELHSTCTP